MKTSWHNRGEVLLFVSGKGSFCSHYLIRCTTATGAACNPCPVWYSLPPLPLSSWRQSPVFRGRQGSGFKRGDCFPPYHAAVVVLPYPPHTSGDSLSPQRWCKPLSGQKQSRCSFREDEEKERGASFIAVQWKYQKQRATSPGLPRMEWENPTSLVGIATCSFQPHKWHQVAKPASKRSKCGFWERETTETKSWKDLRLVGGGKFSLHQTQLFAASSFLCTNTYSASCVRGSFIVLLERCKLRSKGNIKHCLLNEGDFNLL